MLHNHDILTFDSAASLSIPSGTRARVCVLPDADGDPRITTGTNAYGRWMRIDFEVVDGPHAGRQAALMLTFDPRDRDFRRALEVITNRQLSAGMTVKMTEVSEALADRTFSAELGPQKRRGRETGYTNVVRLFD